MCKFHKTVARDIATNPVTGKIDPARYAVALVALKYRIEEYMPAMFGSNGYSTYELATPLAVQSLKDSGIVKRLEDIKTFRDDNIGLLRAAMDETAQRKTLTTAALNLPKNPMKDTRFLDEATVELFDGYTDAKMHYAANGLSLKNTAHKPEFEPLRATAEAFLTQPGVEPVLKKMFENSMARICLEAQEKANPILLKAYEKIPQGLRRTFGACAACGGSVVVPHLPCIGLMVAASSSAVAASVVGNPYAVAALSVTAAAGGYRSWNRQRGSFAAPLERRIMKGAFTLAAGTMIAMHVPAFGMHHHHGGEGGHDHHHHDHHHMMQGSNDNPVKPAPEAQAWLDGLDPAARRKVEEKAASIGMSVGEYTNGMCGLPPVPCPAASGGIHHGR